MQTLDTTDATQSAASVKVYANPNTKRYQTLKDVNALLDNIMAIKVT